LYGRLDPPHGVGGEAEAFLRVEALDGLHQPDIAFGNHLGNRQAIAAIAHRDLGDEPEMAGDELMRRIAVAMLVVALGEHVFLARLQHWKLTDFIEIPAEAGIAGGDRRQAWTGH
jgi:hypothetical protein